MLLTGGHCYYTWDDCTCTSELLTGHWHDWFIPGCSREASSRVHRYTHEEGWVEDLPDLTVGRYGHGCAAFTMDEEQVINQTFHLEKRKVLHMKYFIFYVLDLPRSRRMWTLAVGSLF